MPRIDYDAEWGDWLEKTHDPDAQAYFAFYLPEGSNDEQPGTAGPAHDTLAEQTDTDR